jgi:ABC-type nitrate/sulfonate/bicarbonate transport system ATPase subunit
LKTCLKVSNLQKTFEEKPIFSNISFELKEHEILTFIGPSGCGKSSLLNIISGIDNDYSGEILIETDEVKKQEKKSISFVQQRDLLIPWKTVLENATFGLEIGGGDKHSSRLLAIDLLKKFNLEGSEEKFPHQLSGGMRQRVSLMRSVLLQKPILLLDEPFASLDSITRENLQEWLIDLLDEFRFSVILVTHDIYEAIKISDRIIVLGGSPSEMIDEIIVNRANKENMFRRIRENLSGVIANA